MFLEPFDAIQISNFYLNVRHMLSVTDILFFPSNHTQATIQGKTGYVLRLVYDCLGKKTYP